MFLRFIRKNASYLVLLGLLALFLGFRLPTLGPGFTEGWMYFYFGKLVAEGATPYVDFYYSSPPFLLYFTGLLHWLFGFQLDFAVILPTLLSALDAILIFALLRKKTSNFGALLAVAAYLFAYVNIATIGAFSEAHVVTTLSLAGLLFFLNRYYLLAGMAFGLSGLTKLYGLVPAVLPTLWLARQPRQLLRFASGGALTFGIPNLIFLFVAGREYLDMIFFTHLGKVARVGRGGLFYVFMINDVPLLLASALILFVKRWRPLALPLLATIPLIVFYFIYPDVYYLYLKLLAAFLAVLLAVALSGEFRYFSRHTARIAALIIVGGGALLSVARFQTFSVAAPPADTMFEEMATTVRMELNPGEPLYGGFKTAPFVALLADRPLFRNYVDTSHKFIGLGVIDLAERARELEKEKVRLVVTKANIDPKTESVYGPGLVLPQEFFSQNCKALRYYHAPNAYEMNTTIFWRCLYEGEG